MIDPEDQPARRAAEIEVKRCAENSIRNGIVDIPAIAVIQAAQREARQAAISKMLEKTSV